MSSGEVLYIPGATEMPSSRILWPVLGIHIHAYEKDKFILLLSLDWESWC